MIMKKGLGMIQIMIVTGNIEENLHMISKEEVGQEVQIMIIEIGIVTEDITEAVIEIETIIGSEEDHEVMNLDGKEMRGKVVTGTDIVTMIETVIVKEVQMVLSLEPVDLRS